MKKSLLISYFTCITLILSAQTKITGFGKLKLGSPISIINELGYSIDSVSDSNTYFTKVYKNKNAKSIYKLLADSLSEDHISGTYMDSKVNVFFVPRCFITENIELTSLKLKFYNGVLIDIFCDLNTNLSDALTIKFGKPKTDLKEKEHQFTYTYTGNTVTKTDQTFNTIWETNDLNVSCIEVIMKWYDDKGKENYISYTHLSNLSYDVAISDAENAIKERINDRELQKKKKLLQDF